jgi:3-hydroxyisobutyrate dehydrogenase-like beta-hydroxyacid dehydrogenase
MALAAKAGVDPDVACEVMKTTAADNWQLRNTTQALSLDRNFAPRFKLQLAHKDLGLAVAMGLGLGVPLALGQASHLLHTIAMGQGLGEEDRGACLKASSRRQAWRSAGGCDASHRHAGGALPTSPPCVSTTDLCEAQAREA